MKRGNLRCEVLQDATYCLEHTHGFFGANGTNSFCLTRGSAIRYIKKMSSYENLLEELIPTMVSRCIFHRIRVNSEYQNPQNPRVNPWNSLLSIISCIHHVLPLSCAINDGRIPPILHPPYQAFELIQIYNLRCSHLRINRHS